MRPQRPAPAALDAGEAVPPRTARGHGALCQRTRARPPKRTTSPPRRALDPRGEPAASARDVRSTGRAGLALCRGTSRRWKVVEQPRAVAVKPSQRRASLKAPARPPRPRQRNSASRRGVSSSGPAPSPTIDPARARSVVGDADRAGAGDARAAPARGLRVAGGRLGKAVEARGRPWAVTRRPRAWGRRARRRRCRGRRRSARPGTRYRSIAAAAPQPDDAPRRGGVVVERRAGGRQAPPASRAQSERTVFARAGPEPPPRVLAVVGEEDVAEHVKEGRRVAAGGRGPRPHARVGGRTSLPQRATTLPPRGELTWKPAGAGRQRGRAVAGGPGGAAAEAERAPVPGGEEAGARGRESVGGVGAATRAGRSARVGRRAVAGSTRSGEREGRGRSARFTARTRRT